MDKIDLGKTLHLVVYEKDYNHMLWAVDEVKKCKRGSKLINCRATLHNIGDEPNTRISCKVGDKRITILLKLPVELIDDPEKLKRYAENVCKYIVVDNVE